MHCWLSGVVHCVYTKQLESKMVVSLVWVEDIIVPASDMVLLSEIKEMLQGRPGRLSYFRGIEQGIKDFKDEPNTSIKFW